MRTPLRLSANQPHLPASRETQREREKERVGIDHSTTSSVHAPAKSRPSIHPSIHPLRGNNTSHPSRPQGITAPQRDGTAGTTERGGRKGEEREREGWCREKTASRTPSARWWQTCGYVSLGVMRVVCVYLLDQRIAPPAIKRSSNTKHPYTPSP
mmetsp:Transcript_26681/g.76511  ORF Transcript_26681/g.76511 Transcript_26681/m.76511 type:complete len:155 (+) Transcript_26681:1043-1507(+)